jgi:hypothetical protein
MRATNLNTDRVFALREIYSGHRLSVKDILVVSLQKLFWRYCQHHSKLHKNVTILNENNCTLITRLFQAAVPRSYNSFEKCNFISLRINCGLPRSGLKTFRQQPEVL